MHKRTFLAAFATATVTAIAVPSVSRAQDPKPTPQPPTTTQQTSKGEVATQPSVTSFMRAIDSLSARVDQLKAMPSISPSNVQLVNVEDLAKGSSADSVQAAIQHADTAAVSALRSTLGADSTLASALSANSPSITPADVVAADVGSDGKVTLYYWKKP